MQNNLETLLEDRSIAKVCNGLLDKLDKQGMSERSHHLITPINEKYFPELFYPSIVDEDVRLEMKLKELIFLGLFKIKQIKKKSYLPLSERGAKLIFNSEFEDKLRSFYNRKIQQNSWLEAISKKDIANKSILTLLEKNPIKIKHKSDDEVLEQLLKWIETNKSKSARKESSRCFWGLSKIFDNQEAYKIYFGLKDMPISLSIYMQTSESIEEVIFIENQDTFYEACESSNKIFKNSVIIYASGYKASAKRIRQRSGSKMYLATSSQHTSESFKKFEAWFYKESSEEIPVYFWGDLDYAGIHILKALKVNFRHIDAWKKGYDIMVKEVKEDFGHTPEMAGKEKQLSITYQLLECDYTNQLLIPNLTTKALFIDQEFVIIEKL